MVHTNSRRLRIALVVPYFPLERYEKGFPHVMDTIERLAQTCDIDVVSLRDSTAHGAYKMAGTRARRLGLRHARGPAGRARVLAGGIREVLRMHRRSPIDVVHAVGIDEPGAVATVSARLLRRPSIATVVGGELVAFPDLWYGAALARGGRWTNALTLRLATAVTVGSVEMCEMVKRHGRDAMLLPLGVDVARFAPAADGGSVKTERRVIFCGALEAIKQPALALRTFALLAAERQDLRLDIYGDGTLRAYLEELTSSLGVRDRVTFHGHASHLDMPAAYAGAWVLLITSRFESQCVVALEAMASAVPIVSTKVGLMPELGDAAITVDMPTEEALAAATARVLDDPAAASRMGAAGRAFAAERFAFGQRVAAFHELYASLAK